MDPLEVVAPHLRNFVVQVSIPQYGRSLDDRTWGALQPILSSTFASTSTSRATSFAPASAPRPPLPPPPARPPTTPPASASAATRTTSKRRLPVAAGGYLEVPAALRLLDWVPPGSSLLSARDPQQRRRVLAAAWAESTLATYGTGLLRWLLWCEQHALPASARFPAHVGDVVDFIESVAGHFSGGSIRNWVSGLRAWHAIHGSALDTVHLRIVTALRGADRLTPESSKKPPPEHHFAFTTSGRSGAMFNPTVRLTLLSGRAYWLRSGDWPDLVNFWSKMGNPSIRGGTPRARSLHGRPLRVPTLL
ncbi:hypothetical protein CF336_g8878 [Tilletia laevis]|nr:hypothetical protein CF336_g8878 [Tilletia laevis]